VFSKQQQSQVIKTPLHGSGVFVFKKETVEKG